MNSDSKLQSTKEEMNSDSKLQSTNEEGDGETRNEVRSERMPKFIVMRSRRSGRFLKYVDEPVSERGFVTNTETSMFETMCKIEVERANIDNNLVHLRFSYSNKYFATNAGNWRIRATSNQPEEDRSKPSCTLFEPFRHSDGVTFSFRQVHTGRVLSSLNNFISSEIGSVLPLHPNRSFDIVDWDTIVVLPKNVAFKGHNDSYLMAWRKTLTNYVRFSSSDPNEIESGYEVTMLSDGQVVIKSLFFNYYLRRLGSNWITGGSDDTSDINTLFRPIKLNSNTIALRNRGNDLFCVSEGSNDYLRAAQSTITNRARLEVVELVLDRQIINVTYRMEHARIYNEAITMAGEETGQNSGDHTSSMTMQVGYEEERSQSFTNSQSITTSVTTSISAGVPTIFETGIEISAAVTSSLEWNTTTTTKRTAIASYTADVPPLSMIRVQYLATVGKCDVPFSYTRIDRHSHDGSTVTSRHHDGIFTGSNYYSFHFNQHKIEPIPSASSLSIKNH